MYVALSNICPQNPVQKVRENVGQEHVEELSISQFY